MEGSRILVGTVATRGVGMLLSSFYLEDEWGYFLTLPGSLDNGIRGGGCPDSRLPTPG